MNPAKRTYYEILELQRTATADEIKKSYHRLALKYHPDRNKDMGSDVKFKEINEAAEVLCDPERKLHYDQQLNAQYDIFGAMGSLFGMFGKPSAANSSAPSSYPSRSSEQPPSKPAQNANRKKDPTTHVLYCTLEELFLGLEKKESIRRKTVDKMTGFLIEVERLVNVKLARGWKTGTKITYPNEGDEDLFLATGDLIILIEELPHPIFTKEHNDLVLKKDITLYEALVGTRITFVHLDGTEHEIDLFAVNQTTGWKKIITGQGYISSKDQQRGDLIISVNILFPILSADERELLKASVLSTCTYQ